MPATGQDAAERTARHLARVVGSLAHHTRAGAGVAVSARIACALAETDADRLLDGLNASLERPPAASAAAAA